MTETQGAIPAAYEVIWDWFIAEVSLQNVWYGLRVGRRKLVFSLFVIFLDIYTDGADVCFGLEASPSLSARLIIMALERVKSIQYFYHLCPSHLSERMAS